MQAPFHLQIEVTTAPKGAFDETLARVADEEARYPFDLTAQPAFRARLVQDGQDKHGLVLTAHHIICDGWSHNILFEELAALYRAQTGGAAADLPEPASFAAHARRVQNTAPRSETRAFWASQYQDIPSLPELPCDRPRPQRRSFAGATLTRFISSDLMIAARKAGAKQRCTLFGTLFGALQITLGRLSGSNDVVIGVPTGGQAQLENPNMIGHAVNLLPIRATIDPAATVADHLKRVSGAVMDAFDHQDYTFGTLVQDLNVPRALNRLPLTEIQFNLETLPEDLDMGAVQVKLAPNKKGGSNFDMFFNVVESKDGLRLDVDYNCDVFDAGTIERWIGHFEHVICSIATDTAQAVRDLDLSTPVAGGAVDQSYADYDRSAMIQTLVDRTAAVSPDSIALEDGTRQLSYRALQQNSDALAAHIQTQVAGTGQRIGLVMERSVDMVVGLLAILKAGHTYLPLDPTQPEARLKLILETAKAAAVLTDTPAQLGYASAAGAVLIDAASATAGAVPTQVPHDPDDSAYIIFTSGTTGTPKGVEIPHRAVVNFLNSMAQKPGLVAEDTLLSVTTVMFDIAVLELFLPLSVGAKCVIASKEQVLDGFALVDRLQQGDITVMQATPTLWDMVLDAGFAPQAGMKLLAGGEPLPKDLAARLMAQGAELWNMYGPTETTIWSAVEKVAADEPITIGHAIANTSLVILDTNDKQVPVGVTGELNIGGHGLAKGYLDRADLTGKAFRNVTVKGTSERLYRTGDLARQTAAGTIEVLGRIDTQVKLRGFRIELGEIESRLRGLDGIHKAAVDVKTRASGDRQLVAYIVADGGATPDVGKMRQGLAAVLPNYMVPQAYVTLDALPQTANGKLDRKSLPDPDTASEITPEPVARAVTSAKTPTEEQIRDIWENVLGRGDISTTDTLFDLGVDSLMVFRIAARLAEAGLNLQAKHLLDHPTIAALAAFADSASKADAPKIPAALSLKDFRYGARRTVGIVQ